jgi:hypothetical protein
MPDKGRGRGAGRSQIHKHSNAAFSRSSLLLLGILDDIYRRHLDQRLCPFGIDVKTFDREKLSSVTSLNQDSVIAITFVGWKDMRAESSSIFGNNERTFIKLNQGNIFFPFWNNSYYGFVQLQCR